MKTFQPNYIAWLICALTTSSVQLFACPQSGEFLDYNCDQKLRYVITGDSIVAGIGDSSNGNRGGYVKRFDALLPGPIRVVGLGVSGIRSDQLLRRFQAGDFRKFSRNADLFVIDVGRNDCRDAVPPLQTVRNIKRLVRFARKKTGIVKRGPPFVVVATLIPDRERRRACIEEVNRILLQKKSLNLPVFLRFDKLPPTILGGDQLHPTSAGYQRMARKLFRFSKNSLQARMNAERVDTDSDGIFDFHEVNRFDTNPDLLDTDEDTLNDGAEVFTHTTDPNDPDSDDDTRNDGQEILDGTDPLVPD